MDLLKKKDVRRYELVLRLCHRDWVETKRFRFLTDWDPLSLTTHPIGNSSNFNTSLPLHYAAWSGDRNQFRIVFGAGLRHFPMKQGILVLFQKDATGCTPFKDACEHHGIEETTELVEDALLSMAGKPVVEDLLDLSYNGTQSVLLASTSENIALDSLYFFLRRQPDLLLVKVLPLEGIGNNDGDIHMPDGIMIS